MSIPVDPTDLARALADFDAGYLLTVVPVGVMARLRAPRR